MRATGLHVQLVAADLPYDGRVQHHHQCQLLHQSELQALSQTSDCMMHLCKPSKCSSCRIPCDALAGRLAAVAAVCPRVGVSPTLRCFMPVRITAAGSTDAWSAPSSREGQIVSKPQGHNAALVKPSRGMLETPTFHHGALLGAWHHLQAAHPGTDE